MEAEPGFRRPTRREVPITGKRRPEGDSGDISNPAACRRGPAHLKLELWSDGGGWRRGRWSLRPGYTTLLKESQKLEALRNLRPVQAGGGPQTLSLSLSISSKVFVAVVLCCEELALRTERCPKSSTVIGGGGDKPTWGGPVRASGSSIAPLLPTVWAGKCSS